MPALQPSSISSPLSSQANDCKQALVHVAIAQRFGITTHKYNRLIARRMNPFRRDGLQGVLSGSSRRQRTSDDFQELVPVENRIPSRRGRAQDVDPARDIAFHLEQAETVASVGEQVVSGVTTPVFQLGALLVYVDVENFLRSWLDPTMGTEWPPFPVGLIPPLPVIALEGMYTRPTTDGIPFASREWPSGWRRVWHC
jgi:hypothetical protein